MADDPTRPKPTPREQRLAAALRGNLKRRKAAEKTEEPPNEDQRD